MELDPDVFPNKLTAVTVKDKEFAELESSVEVQDLRLAELAGLLYYFKGCVWTVVRDVRGRYELIQLEYISTEVDII